VYAYPGAVQPLSAVYNQTELDKLGLKAPTTLTEVYKLCADAKAAGIYAYAQGLGEAAAGPQMLSFGQAASLVYGPTPDFDKQIADGTTTYAKSPWVDQFKIYKQMFDQGCFGKGSLGRSRQQGAEAVAGGKALGQVDVGAQLGIVQGLAPKSSFVIAPIPATDDGNTFITALPGYTVAVNAKAKNPTAAKAFLEFLAEPEQSVIYANGFSSVPIIPNDQYTAPKELAGFADLVAAGKYAKLANVLPKVQTALNESVQSMLLGKDTPESAAEKMDQARKG
jgi:raffinose/stachyose/melibiose transport system substrate-binding protein